MNSNPTPKKIRNKRGNGEGTIYLRTSTQKFEGKIFLGIVNGKKKYKTFTGATKTEVANKMKALKTKYIREGYAYGGDITLEKLLTDWLEVFTKNSLSENTYVSYQFLIYKNIVPVLGKYQVKDITATMIQKFYNNLIESGGKYKSGLSPTTVRKINGILKRAFSLAMSERYITNDPLKIVKPPKKFKKKINILEENEVEAFLNMAINHETYKRHYLLFLIAIFCGLRRGELLGLPYKNIDYQNECIYVNQQLVKDGAKGQVIKEALKTKGSERTICFPSFILKHIEEHKKFEREKFEALNYSEEEIGQHFENGLVFTNEYGTPYNVDNVRRIFSGALEAASLKHMRVHDFRHQFASLSIWAGVDIATLQKEMGHSSSDMLIETYLHASAKTLKESANKRSELLGQK